MSDTLQKTYQQALYRRFEGMAGVHFEVHKDQLAVRVENQAASGLVYLRGGLLASYQRHNQAPLIWSQPEQKGRGGQPAGGVPVCWPWVGSLESNHLVIRRQVGVDIAEANGCVGNRPWQLESIEHLDPETTRIVLKLSQRDLPDKLWPLATELQLSFIIGKRLQVRLEIENQTPYPIYFTAALQSHFAISAINNIEINGLERMNYEDCDNSLNFGRQRGPLTIDKAINRIYHGTWAPLNIVDHGLRRAIFISPEGSDSSIISYASREQELKAGDYLSFATANVGEDFILLKAYEKHALGYVVRLR